MHRTARVTLAIACFALAPACRRPSPPSTGPKATQLDRGLVAFGNYCAGCHGSDGEGSETAPALVGAEALPRTPPEGRERTASFETAKDVFDYASQEMPRLAPGSLDERQYWDIVAFLAKENGANVGDDVGPDSGAGVKLRP